MENIRCPILTTNTALATDYLILHTKHVKRNISNSRTLLLITVAVHFTLDPTTPSRQQAQVSSTRDLTFSMFLHRYNQNARYPERRATNGN